MSKRYPHTYRDLHEHMNRFNTFTSPAKQEIAAEKKKLKDTIDTLDTLIFIGNGTLAADEKALLEKHGFEIPKKNESPFIDIADCEGEAYRELFPLTVAGKIEHTLVDKLRQFELDTIDEWVTVQEEMHNASDGQKWESYNQDQQYAENNLDSLEWGDGGRIYPEPPSSDEFDRDASEEEREEALKGMTEEDMCELVPAGDIAEYFYQEFFSDDCIADITEAINTLGINSPRINHFLHSLDTQFNFQLLQKDYFLTATLKNNVDLYFGKKHKKINAKYLAKKLITALASQQDNKPLLDAYESAAAKNDSLGKQQWWPFFAELAYIAIGSIKKLETLPKRVEHRLSALRKKDSWKKRLPTLIKVFPNDQVRQLCYRDANFPLSPSFQRLAFANAHFHKALCHTKSALESTNVIAATLVFAFVKEHAEGGAPKKMKRDVEFLEVDLTLSEYDVPVLSIDEVFANKAQEEACIAASLSLGTKITKRPNPLVEEKASLATEQIARMVATLDLPNKAELLKAIASADIADPEALQYHMSSKNMKETKHRHSERVLIGALNNPKNAVVITHLIRAALAKKHSKGGLFAILSTALLVHSYRNSVCDPCALSLISLQNTHDGGFLKHLADALNTHEHQSPIILKTNDYNKGKQDPNAFALTVVAASHSIFAQDFHGKVLAEKIEFRTTCRHSTGNPEPGINLENPANRRGLFEFAEGSELHKGSKSQAPYKGVFCMSGSKVAKLNPKQTAILHEKTMQIRQTVVPPC